MPTPPFQPKLEDVVRHGIEEALADVHTAVPAKVTKVDLAKGLIDARPLVKDVYEPRRGERTAVSVPIITNVPIVWPGANGFRVTFPLVVGDFVLLVFAERSIDSWLVNGQEVDPGDPRRHAISDAIAIPGLRPFGKAWKGASASAVTIGSETGTEHWATWADKTMDDLENLKAALENHTHDLRVTGVQAGPSTVPVIAGALPPAQSTPPLNVTLIPIASATVKIKG